ncbi:MAG: portal protein [Microcystaceae cyanobacterium]
MADNRGFPKMDEYMATVVEPDRRYTVDSFDNGVVSYVRSKLQYFQQARLNREETWLECWAMYFGTPEAERHLRGRVSSTVGDVNTDWRHRLSTGKAFEQVETVNAYLMQAFFPNKDWFDLKPMEPGYSDVVPSVKEFLRKKFQSCNFVSYWEMFIRQLLVTGTSVIALPWRVETVQWKKRVKINSPKFKDSFYAEYGQEFKFRETNQNKTVYNAPAFEVLDNFDCYFDPRAISTDESDFCRRIIKTKAEVVELINSKYYKDIEPLDVVTTDPYYGGNAYAQDKKNQLYKFQGIQIENGYNWTDQVEIWEYWGDITVDGIIYRDVVATIMGDKLIRFENNPYWCSKPFIFGTYTSVNRSITSIGLVEPGLGLLHEFNLLTNQRLDNLELSVDSMWLYVNDGTLQPEDIYTRPGRVFSVAQKDVLTPISMPQQFTVTYDESSVLESRIDRNAGTGNLISANAARDAERVTAEEVKATREAGGNRLSFVHKHIEETALMPLLSKMLRLFQQFVTGDEVVRVAGNEPGSYDYNKVGQDELNYEYDIVPYGADHVTDKEYDMAQRLQFYQLILSNPDASQHFNHFNFLLDLARRMGIDDVQQFVQENQNTPLGSGGQDPSQQQQQQLPPAAGSQQMLDQGLQQTGGKGLVNYVNQNLNADGGATMMKDQFGLDMSQVPAPAQQAM